METINVLAGNEKVDPYNELYYVGCYLAEAIDQIKALYTCDPTSKIGAIIQLNERWKSIAQQIANADCHRSFQ